MIHVLVEQVLPKPGETIWLARGIEPETGDTIVFGGDWRPMSELALVVSEDGLTDAVVEPWQVLTRARPPGDAS